MEQNYFGGATFGTSIPNPQIDTALSSIESATYPNTHRLPIQPARMRDGASR